MLKFIYPALIAVFTSLAIIPQTSELGVDFIRSMMGVTGWFLWKAGDHLSNFNWSKWLEQNEVKFSWALMLSLFLVGIYHLEPDSINAVLSSFGISLDKPYAPLFMGGVFAAAAYSKPPSE